MPNVFATVEYYLPGFRSGGPLRSVSGLVDRLGDHFQFHILTRDHDVSQAAPFPGIRRDDWNQVGKAMVFYASNFRRRNLQRAVAQASPDLFYLNSCFTHINVRLMSLRRLHLLPDVPVIVCPRGEFSEGSLTLKSWKKRAYLSAAFPLGLYDRVYWHATSATEEEAIRKVAGANAKVYMAPNLSSIRIVPAVKPAKRAGNARFVFLGRIVRVKNLLQGLRSFVGVNGHAEVDVYGPMEDHAYWAECRSVIAALPAGIRVEYRGELPHNRVTDTLAQYHFFLLPTFGESFGHSILEGLASGCPAVISDQTQFRGLRGKNAGWDLPLADTHGWTSALQSCIDMDAAEFAASSAAAQKLASDLVGPAAAEPSAAMFRDAIAGSRAAVAI